MMKTSLRKNSWTSCSKSFVEVPFLEQIENISVNEDAPFPERGSTVSIVQRLALNNEQQRSSDYVQANKQHRGDLNLALNVCPFSSDDDPAYHGGAGRCRAAPACPGQHVGRVCSAPEALWTALHVQ